MNKMVTFVSEVKAEIKKITWPTKDELIGTTIIVCIIVLVFALILGFMDAMFSALLKRLVG
ncbi:MAG: Preprotein translocase, SecE subunit [candidate division TM6 bacterium GW2011_GWF2_37_49]|nr:MAG: Preprotein translocase, SecE subunit [candidate division TM6 bacterium GW2011_GWF2_37_49]